LFFAIRSFVSDIWAKREQINAKNYLCRNTGCRYVLSPLAARGVTVDNTPGDKLGVWRDMRLADALIYLFIYFFTAALFSGPG